MLVVDDFEMMEMPKLSILCSFLLLSLLTIHMLLSLLMKHIPFQLVDSYHYAYRLTICNNLYIYAVQHRRLELA